MPFQPLRPGTDRPEPKPTFPNRPGPGTPQPKPGKLLTTLITAAVAVVVVGVGCGPDPVPDPATATTVAESTPPPAAVTPLTDPYDLYLELAPADAPELTRDDAQARALLGCGSVWAPGTVDGALAEAYAPLVVVWAADGFCD